MAKKSRGMKKSKPEQAARVHHPEHLKSLVVAAIVAEDNAKAATTDIKAKVKAAKQSGGLDPTAFDIAKKLTKIETPEKAKRKAEMIVLALYDLGFLDGDLLTSTAAQALRPWTEEIRKQYCQTDSAGRVTGGMDAPVFDNTDAAAAHGAKVNFEAGHEHPKPMFDDKAEDPELVAKRAAMTAEEIAAYDADPRNKVVSIKGRPLQERTDAGTTLIRMG
jgi:hypothetical protein